MLEKCVSQMEIFRRFSGDLKEFVGSQIDAVVSNFNNSVRKFVWALAGCICVINTESSGKGAGESWYCFEALKQFSDFNPERDLRIFKI